jgi:hypothetical protein
MIKLRAYLWWFLVGVCLILLSQAAFAEEGMWTLDNLPLKLLKDKYNFSPSPEWLKKVQLASVRFNDGGSGSFISPTGLVITNHHVAVGQLQKMSSPEKDYVKDGFYARNPLEEIKCPDLELNVLVAMENVTEEINKVIKGLPEKEALKARKAEIARIEKESLVKTGMRSDVVSLYNGGEYWLYVYKKYRDVRLVFAPEKQIAFFGGDPDNFTYPRYDLDFAIFRVYENDKPVQAKYYLTVNPAGASEDELVFVSGHPGSTKRLITYAQLLFLRDYFYPYRLENYERKIALLQKYAAGSAEQQRRAATLIFGLQNGYKAYRGEFQGLLDIKEVERFKQNEESFKALTVKYPELKQEVNRSFEEISSAFQKYEKRFNDLNYKYLGGYKLPGMATTLVTYAAEIQKPDAERLEGFHDSQLDTLKFVLLSPAPIYKDIEELLLADFLKQCLEKFGASDEFVKIILAGKAPEVRAKELIQGTHLAEVEYRKALLEGGIEAIKKSEDPLIQLALKLDPYKREQVKWTEDNFESIVIPASETIARARFKIYGKSTYPDATFTLRLAFGVVKGYPMNGTLAPCWTTLYGLYDRYYSFARNYPWSLPARYLEREKRLNLSTPLNFVCTADIIGGNSGSPVINTKGEFVGVIFDGNIESLAGRFIYVEEVNRAVAVHSGAIIEALTQLYDAQALVKEIIKP